MPNRFVNIFHAIIAEDAPGVIAYFENATPEELTQPLSPDHKQQLLEAGFSEELLSSFGLDKALGCLPLHIAVIYEKFESIKKLLSRAEVEINAVSNNGTITLTYACAIKDNSLALSITKLLLDKGADPKHLSGMSKPPLISACMRANWELVDLLLTRGVKIGDCDEQGLNALLWAAHFGVHKIAAGLLDRGIDVNATNLMGESALFYACNNGHSEIVGLLLFSRRGIIELDRKNGIGRTALMQAAAHGHHHVVSMLISEGVNINQIDRDGNSALLLACATGKTDVAKLLMNHGVNVNTKNTMTGDTPLMTAMRYQQRETAEMLLALNADINQTNTNHENALMIAAQKGDDHMLTTLLNLGSSYKQQNRDGKNALDFAINNKSKFKEPVNAISQLFFIEFNQLDVSNRLNITTPRPAILRRGPLTYPHLYTACSYLKSKGINLSAAAYAPRLTTNSAMSSTLPDDFFTRQSGTLQQIKPENQPVVGKKRKGGDSDAPKQQNSPCKRQVTEKKKPPKPDDSSKKTSRALFR